MRPSVLSDVERLRGFAIVAILFLSSALNGGTTLAKGVFFDGLSHEFDLGSAATAALLSTTQFVGIASTLLGGWFLRHNRTPQYWLAGAALLDGLGYAWAGVAQSYSQLVAAYFLIGAGAGAAVMMPLVLRNWFPHHTGTVLGITMAGITAGGVIVTPLINLVVEQWGWRAGYLALAVPAVLVLVPLYLAVLRFAPASSRPVAVGAAAERSAGAADPEQDGFTILQATATPTFWLLLIAKFIFFAVCFSFFLFFVPSLKEAGYSSSEAVLAMSSIYFLASLSKLGFGYASDRIGVRKILIGSLLATSVILLLMIHMGGRAQIYGFVLLYGLVYSAPLVLFTVIVLDVFGRRHFTALTAVINVVANVGSAVGPIIGGWILDQTDRSFTTLYAASAVAFLISGLLVLASGRPVRRAARTGTDQLILTGEPT
ncbi:MFS transporter [Sphingobium lignivorans]|uniref:MFS family arabinose efflux permease n=1 Tax=Sphingobium lignivorans TaxID=2735886 RepID=A0ABR6NH69_9SPHN|nr:MFS transporter [Sphingobium lignivorans]MBB5986611.1 putative MFS family arabinose efflux permease [Sphingobium lignivorans]